MGSKTIVASPMNRTLPTILIVDDDLFMRRLLRMLLETAQYRVIETENGQQGLNAYQLYHPDIVLMDAQMPGMDGFPCC